MHNSKADLNFFLGINAALGYGISTSFAKLQTMGVYPQERLGGPTSIRLWSIFTLHCWKQIQTAGLRHAVKTAALLGLQALGKKSLQRGRDLVHRTGFSFPEQQTHVPGIFLHSLKQNSSVCLAGWMEGIWTGIFKSKFELLQRHSKLCFDHHSTKLWISSLFSFCKLNFVPGVPGVTSSAASNGCFRRQGKDLQGFWHVEKH